MPKPNSDCRATERKHPWPMVRLGDVCEIIAGQSPEGSYYTDESCYTEFHQGRKCFGARELQVSGVYTKKETKIAKPGALLISVRAPVGDLNVTTRRVCIGRGLAALIPDDSISRDFLWLFLTSATKAVNDAAGAGSCFSSLSRSQLSGLEIPLPPLSVQREIVSRLERELAAVEKMKKGFEELAETAKAEFEAERLETHKELLCGKWPCELLKKHVDILAGYAFQSKGFVESGIRVCGGLIIAPDRIKWEECKYWKSSNGIEQYLLQDKDIVIALDRPWISGGFKMGEICKRDLPCLLIQRTARLRMKDVDFRYVMMLLRDESFKSHCTTSGTTVPHISHKDIETYEIPFPPERVQKEIVDRLFVAKTRAEKLEAKAREGVAVCEIMRKAILKEAFEGG